MSKRKKVVSYSQLKKWRECPHRWYLDYGLSLRSRIGNIYSVFGTAMHETMQTYLQMMYDISVKKANEIDLQEVLEEKMLEQVKDQQRRCEKYGEKFEDTGITRDLIEEFYDDGVAILEWFKKKRSDYFLKRNYELVGIEVPVDMELKEQYGVDVKMMGFLDVVTKSKKTDTYYIYDLKTSTKGWSKYRKKDKKTTDQLVLYKKFYSDKYGVDPDDIEVEFLIMKRKVPDNPEWPAMGWRMQRYSPADGSISRNKVTDKFKNFLQTAFTEDGEYKHDREYEKNPDKYTCRFCDYNDRPDLCDKNGEYVGYMDKADHAKVRSGEIEENLDEYKEES